VEITAEGLKKKTLYLPQRREGGREGGLKDKVKLKRKNNNNNNNNNNNTGEAIPTSR